ncbi:hypothetical protein a10_08480 [Streptomyces acidiscabies]|nr:hypothetical protein a10_08480 [Streptomyces acidiscabies]
MFSVFLSPSYPTPVIRSDTSHSHSATRSSLVRGARQDGAGAPRHIAKDGPVKESGRTASAVAA